MSVVLRLIALIPVHEQRVFVDDGLPVRTYTDLDVEAANRQIFTLIELGALVRCFILGRIRWVYLRCRRPSLRSRRRSIPL